MFSPYQIVATSYANRSLSIHDRINDLHKRAHGLAPAVEESAAESGCTDTRPSGERPRAQRAWDMCAEALAWNAISDDPALIADADRHEDNRMPYRVTLFGPEGMTVTPILPDTCCTQTKLTPGRHSTRCPVSPTLHCVICNHVIYPDSLYASGYRHTESTIQLHGAVPQ